MLDTVRPHQQNASVTQDLALNEPFTSQSKAQSYTFIHFSKSIPRVRLKLKLLINLRAPISRIESLHSIHTVRLQSVEVGEGWI